MKYLSKAIPSPAKGGTIKNPGGKLTVPDSAMSLAEILRRFTRGEAVAVGREPIYHESDDDLDKVAHSDLTEKAEFVERQKATQAKFDKEQKAIAKARRKELEAQERAKIAAELKSQTAKEPAPGG